MPENGGRSFVDVVEDVVHNVQEIVRSEVRLARAEVTTETKKAARASAVLGAGVLFAFYSIGLLILAAVYALTLAIPAWASALVVWAVVSVIAAVLVTAGRARMKQVHPKPERTIGNVKENVQWLKNQTR